uniref:Uncharacterized protein n=1 Tax=Anguilla anguilla TaxID=7936 RepID=A0A0E9RRZ6_ANGAN
MKRKTSRYTLNRLAQPFIGYIQGYLCL